MRPRAAIVALVLAAVPLAVLALDPADWPPAPAVQKRMLELQAVIHDPASTAEQRDKARDELRHLLKSRAARDEVEKDEVKRPPRAAIQPFPSVVKPAESPTVKVPPPPVAHIEVVLPPKPLIIQQSGAPAVPAPGVAIDPRTGQILHETPGGYINPRTGEFIPR
jgi:hypothetical protein